MFFVTGLPRSRTAWFAALLSDGKRHCYHEALNGCESRQEFYDMMEIGNEFGEVGNSDCGLVLTDFQKRWPEAPTVIIHREDAPEPVVGMKKALWNLIGYHIMFEEIDRKVENAYAWLTGDLITVGRLKLFANMNVQVKTTRANPKSLEIWKPIRFE